VSSVDAGARELGLSVAFRTGIRWRSVLPILVLACGVAFVSPAIAVSCEEAAASPAIRWTPLPYPTGSRILQVGPTREFKLPSEAARVARGGDVIEIDAGEYTDTTVWRQDGLWIRGVNGRPHLKAPPQPALGKAIWVISGNDVTVENIEFSGARVPSRNGAGIRAQGRNLTVRASYFHGNEMGLLTNHDADSTITIEFSEFAANGFEGERFHHNIYVGRVGLFVLRHSYSRGAIRGHMVKSRAKRSEILYNRLEDDVAGTSSFELDLSEGGEALVLGNLIVQAATSPNRTMVSYAAENATRWENRLTVAFNTFYSWGTNVVFISNRSTSDALVINNVFGGSVGLTVRGPAAARGNRLAGPSEFVDPTSGNYRLRAGGRGIDAAQDPPEGWTDPPAPAFEPIAPMQSRLRPTHGHRDIGAFEWCP
jgi:hypothetical protein